MLLSLLCLLLLIMAMVHPLPGNSQMLCVLVPFSGFCFF